MQRYSGTAQRGRRVLDDTPLSDGPIPIEGVVAKARYYDPEHRRQRRLGAAEAALLGAGGLLVGHGAQGALKSTRALRSLKVRSGVGSPDVPLGRHPQGRLAAAASRRDLAYLGGGSASITAAGELHRQGDKRLRAWK